MTKYCMRKAFKYISDNLKTGKLNSPSKSIDANLKAYLTNTSSNQSFSIPIPFK